MMFKRLKRILNSKSIPESPYQYSPPNNTEGFLCHTDCERCVCCGRPIPEGAMVCSACTTLCEEYDNPELYASSENKEKKD